MHIEHPNIEKQSLLSKGSKYLLASNVFNKLENIVFFNDKPIDDDEYVQIYGRKNNQRKYMWIKSKYIRGSKNFDKYKVFVPGSNGSGAIGEVLSTPIIGTPIIGTPMVGHTQTFISIGAFDTEQEAQHCLKYVKTKFARTMLGILKITQSNKLSTWSYVPWQDFSNNSDIKWDCSVHEIDDQLYKKYKLTDNEVNFIEANVKPMS